MPGIVIGSPRGYIGEGMVGSDDSLPPVVLNAAAKTWNGSAWVIRAAKVWNGSAWVTRPTKGYVAVP